MTATQDRRKNPPVLFLVLAGLLLFLLPMLLGWKGIFGGEVAFRFYPQQVWLARLFRQGTLPFWDPHTMAGAAPVYSLVSQGSLYPLNWLFWGLAGAQPAWRYGWLVKGPLAAHLLLAALFTFALARRGLRMNPPGSAIFALAYGLSPALVRGASDPALAFPLAWLPLLILCVVRFSFGGSRWWLFLGVLSFAAVSAAGSVLSALSVALSAAIFSFAWVVMAGSRRQWPVLARLIAGALIVLGGGTLLAGCRWAGVFMDSSATGWGGDSTVLPLPLSVPSAHPLFLVTLLFPDFFGAVSGARLWGPLRGLGSGGQEYHLLGGLIAAFTVGCGYLALRAGQEGEAGGAGQAGEAGDGFPEPRAIFWIFIGLFVVSLLPVIGLFKGICFSLFSIIPTLPPLCPLSPLSPLHCLAGAALLGVASHALAAAGVSVRPRRAAFYFLAVGLLVVIGVCWRFPAEGGEAVSGFRELVRLNALPGFLGRIVGYAVAAAAVILAGARWLDRRRFGRLLIILVAVELVIFGWMAFYRPPALSGESGVVTSVVSRDPGKHPAYQLVEAFHSVSADDGGMFRRAYFRSGLDNLAWIYGSHSVLGFDLFPLAPRFERALRRLTSGFPAELVPQDWSLWFWRNLSVREMLSSRPLGPGSRVFRTGLGNFCFAQLASSLPRCYFQDRWVVADPEKELTALLTYDLRATGYCPREVWHVRPYAHLYPVPEPLTEPEWIEYFSALQKNNRIVSSDFSRPNRVILQVDVVKTCMLVMTDLWHPGWRVVVDERPEELHRVNFLQRGVWCRPGKYAVVMEFLPPSLGPGLALTAGGMIVLIGIALSRDKKAKNYK